MGKYVRLIALERKMEKTIILDNEQKTELKLTGIADRIDQIGNQVRIIDYKTGAVTPKKLEVKGVSDAFKIDKEKALQMLHYHFLSDGDFPGHEVVPGIVSLRNISNGFMSVETDPSTSAAYKESLQEFVDQLYSGEVEWKHNQKSDFCHFCE